MIYWPLIDTFMWGFAVAWLGSTDSQTAQLMLSILTALVLWQVIWRAQSEVARNLIDELWNNNLLNMFASPLTIVDWIVSVLLQSVVKMVASAGAVSLAIVGLYAVNIYTLGWWLLPFVLLTMMTGWAVGFISAGIVIRWGQKTQTIVWTLPAVLIPFSAVYYPVSQLPPGMSHISYAVPTTYVFESMRALVFGGDVIVGQLWLSFGLNAVFLVFGLLFFVRMFAKSKELNLARLQS
jgi:ABC-2 type transport system permease protein